MSVTPPKTADDMFTDFYYDLVYDNFGTWEPLGKEFPTLVDAIAALKTKEELYPQQVYRVVLVNQSTKHTDVTKLVRTYIKETDGV